METTAAQIVGRTDITLQYRTRKNVWLDVPGQVRRVELTEDGKVRCVDRDGWSLKMGADTPVRVTSDVEEPAGDERFEEFTEDAAEALVDELAELGHDASVYSGYSGRGMYGARCTGIVTNAPLMMVGYAAARAGIAAEALPCRTDAMGYDTIIY